MKTTEKTNCITYHPQNFNNVRYWICTVAVTARASVAAVLHALQLFEKVVQCDECPNVSIHVIGVACLWIALKYWDDDMDHSNWHRGGWMAYFAGSTTKTLVEVETTICHILHWRLSCFSELGQIVAWETVCDIVSARELQYLNTSSWGSYSFLVASLNKMMSLREAIILGICCHLLQHVSTSNRVEKWLRGHHKTLTWLDSSLLSLCDPNPEEVQLQQVLGLSQMERLYDKLQVIQMKRSKILKDDLRITYHLNNYYTMLYVNHNIDEYMKQNNDEKVFEYMKQIWDKHHKDVLDIGDGYIDFEFNPNTAYDITEEYYPNCHSYILMDSNGYIHKNDISIIEEQLQELQE